MRRISAIMGIIVLAVFGFANAAKAASSPVVPFVTTNGIWWTGVQYPGGIAEQMQYQVTHNGSTPWVRVVGFNAWVGDGSCFLSAGASEFDRFGNLFAGPIRYSWNPPIGPCYHKITVDANTGHGFTTSQMPWMEDTVGYMHGGFTAITTTTNGLIAPVIGG